MKETIRYNLKETLIKESSQDSEEIQLMQDPPINLIDRGYEYMDKGDYCNAFKLFSSGAKENRTDPDILNGMGIALCEMGLLKEALQVLYYAIEKNPEDPVIYANIAGVLWEKMDYDKAIYHYNKSIELDPEIDETFFNLINIYMEIGSFFMALITCNQFIENFPKNEEGLELRNDIILNLAISMF